MIDMTRFKNDRRGLGAGGAIIILILLVVVGFIVATIGMPYIGKQNIEVGDTLSYELTSSGEGNMTGKLSIVITDVETSTLNYSWIYAQDGAGSTGDQTVGYSYAGNVLNVNMSFALFFPIFASPEDMTEFEATYWVFLSGLTPMLVQKYSTTTGTITLTVMVKMGTNLVVASELSNGTDSVKMTLKDCSMLWVKL